MLSNIAPDIQIWKISSSWEKTRTCNPTFYRI